MTPDPALLVVDDNEDNRYTLVQRLKRLGYTNVTTAVDGAKAVVLLHERRFDLVLLDIMMPEMNGYEVLAHMHADDALRHLPVIMISAIDQLDSVVRCLELGAEDYLPKPFNPTLLRARVGATLEKKRLRDELVRALDRIEAELRTARDVQLSLVPDEFPAPDAKHPLDVFGTLEPARQVGGDLFDFFWGEDDRLYFVIGDVSDKGAPAALFMAQTKTMFRLVVAFAGARREAPLSPDHVVARVNEELCRDNRQWMFVTLFFGVVDPVHATLSFCNAGHNPPYLLSRNGGVHMLVCDSGLALGVDATFRYQSGVRQLAPGDCLFAYTDGITEAADAAGDFFLEPRLEAVLGDLTGESARAVVTGVLNKVRGFAGAAAQSDDIAALAIRVPAAAQGAS